MSRRQTRIWLLLPLLFVSGQAAALGLGDIRLNSALNEPLRAEIELLSASVDELENLTVQLASSATFERYGLERPLFLNQLQFDIQKTGSASGNKVRIRSAVPITEPFVTFLVEAVWSRGRLLREYTVLLDPPTFAPPPTTESAQSVSAPSRATQADSGRIERPATSTPTPGPAQPAPGRTTVQAPAQSTSGSAPASDNADDDSNQAPAQSTSGSAPASDNADDDSNQAPAPQANREPAVSAGETRADDRYANVDLTSGQLEVRRGDTLWSIARRVRPDTGLTMDQTMLAIFEANPKAFAGNINVLSAGSVLRIPNTDDVYRINRGEAVDEVQRQHAAWRGGDYVPPPKTTPSLTLVPPDEEQYDYDDRDGASDVSYSRETEIKDRIAQLEADVPNQPGLLQIRNNELAQLRAELARLRGEVPPPVAEPFEEPVEDALDDEPMDEGAVDDEQIFVDDETGVDDTTGVAGDKPPVTDVKPATVQAPAKTSLVDTILGYVMSTWGAIAGAIIVALGILVWFARRAGRDDDDDDSGVWGANGGDMSQSVASTERLRALAREDDTSIVVVEKESKAAMAAEMAADRQSARNLEDDGDITRLRPAKKRAAESSEQTLEDTFSSETAINLDQSDPIAEADFHMAYGLHDQAADLINGALEIEPNRQDLLEKLCEVYFVWGNQDGFVDAAARMKTAVGSKSSAEWDKIVIMGQQIAADHVLFSGKSAGEATKAVDLSFDDDDGGMGELDIDFASGPDGAVSDIIDLGAGSDEGSAMADRSGIDFPFEDMDTSASVTREMPVQARDDSNASLGLDDVFAVGADDATIDSGFGDETAEKQAMSDDNAETVETPTIEQQFASLDATGRMPAAKPLRDDEATTLASLDDDLEDQFPASDQTAEINLDDLGLDLDSFGSELAADDDDDYIDLSDFDATGESLALDMDSLATTGKNPAVEEVDSLAATGRNMMLDDSTDASGMLESLNIDDALGATSEMPGLRDGSDTTGVNPELSPNYNDDSSDDDFGLDTSLLDATGQTQVLSEDYVVETTGDAKRMLDDSESTLLAADIEDRNPGALSDDAETLLAPLDDDDEFAFAKTEALPKDVFTGNSPLDETGELPSLTGSTDLDLDLDDLTAALRVSEVGDTVSQRRDDKTVEQPRLRPNKNLDLDVGDMADDDDWPTQALSPDDVSDDLHDARTMTEVGTKLDLARAYVDMGDPSGARSILEEVLDEGDQGQRQQAQRLLDSLPS